MKITIEHYDEKHSFETTRDDLTVSEVVEHMYCLLHSIGYGAENIRNAFIDMGEELNDEYSDFAIVNWFNDMRYTIEEGEIYESTTGEQI